MIAYCWADGVVELGRVVPQGAVEIARGNVARLQDVVIRPTEWTVRGCNAVRVIPGVEPQLDLQLRKAALSLFLAKIAASNHRDIRINYPIDAVNLC